ncbi:MAG: polyribonucleotide nucleotidyltransferase [Candidatus Paceibacterota bacterium]|jgi:polyribonucleotide nucleotidyltransferase
MKQKEYSIDVGGRKLTAIFSDLADQAHGSVMFKYGETVVLATAVMSHEQSHGLGFFNLTVDYVEKFYAAGKILGNRFTHREGKPSDEAVLSSRVIDRTIRPLFDHRIKNAVQVIVSVLAVDENDPSILAVNAASLALAISDIPWAGPVSAVRIHKNDGKFILNPSREERLNEKYEIDLIVCGKNGTISMIEAAAFESKEEDIEAGLVEALREIGKIEEFQKMIINEIGKEKREIIFEELAEDAKKLFEKEITPKLESHVFSGAGKHMIHELHNEWREIFKNNFPEIENTSPMNDYYDDAVNQILHKEALTNNRRADGRAMDELRELNATAGNISKVLHGSGTFYRGGTHVLSVLTLGGPDNANIIESIEFDVKKRFMHHYNFPPFSSGETGRATMVNRREIGHGALAEKALRAVLPAPEVFPYTIRIVSEAMASNGSSSMASICAGTLALMDGGVPIKEPVAGIAMGLMHESHSEYILMTDIQGPEDEHGDMDFKVAGTKNGITAIQLDIKVDGVPIPILAEAMKKAERARQQILDVITSALPSPRADISPYAPHILTVKIPVTKIGLLIGPGGKTINKIKDDTSAEITIEDDGSVYITGQGENAKNAKKIIEDIIRESMDRDLANFRQDKFRDNNDRRY